MKISCVICSDLFVASAEVFITKCGHLFHHHCLISWFERKSSCPQCRHTATERSIHKVYFSVQDSPSKEDIGALINKVENLEMKNLMSDKSLSMYKDKLKNQESICQDLRLEVFKLEENERTHKSVVLSLKQKIYTLKQKCEEANKLREELASLKQTLQNVENVETAIKGTAEEVETLIRNEGSIESLALVASMLKKSLLETQIKKRNAEKQLRKLNTEFVALKQSHSELDSKFHALQMDQAYLKKNYEMEKGYLKRKISELVKQHQGSIPGDAALLQNIYSESPINVNRTLPALPTSLADNYSMSNSELNSKDLKPSTATGVDCDDLGGSALDDSLQDASKIPCKVRQCSSTFVSGKPYSIFKSESNNSKGHKPSTATGVDCVDRGSAVNDAFVINPKISRKVGHSSSTFASGKPYSIFKSDSNNSKGHKPSTATGVDCVDRGSAVNDAFVIHPKISREVGHSSSTFASGKPYSIFKSESNNSKDHKPSAATGVSYDGLGGSSVEDIFPTAKPRAMKTKQSSLNTAKPPKIRKVSPHEKPLWKP